MNDPTDNPTPTCPECVKLRQEIEVLKAIVHELQQRLNRNSSNSSIPPSANPLDAPKRLPRNPTGRKQGGQPGHRGHHRLQLPPERVTEVVEYIPEKCSDCQAPLPNEVALDHPEPRRHQVAELPPTPVVITEHRAHSRMCTCCGKLNRAEIPPQILSHTIGPRLTAVMSCLSGAYRLSRRSVKEILERVFNVSVSLGTIVKLEAQTAISLADSYDKILAEVRADEVKNTDETGWFKRGDRRWLWVAACRQSAAFRIHASRGADGLKALLGGKIHGMVSSDRWGAYNKLPLEQRQICWSHLGRDFQKHFERGGDAKEVGETGLEVHSCLFSDWNEFRDGKIDRSVLIQRMDQISTELRTQLETGSRSPDKKTRTFCRKLLKIYPALWNFSRIPGVEPTNNFAERTVRGAVIWRKCSYGHQSQLGGRFVERMLSVVTTLKLRSQNVLDYLYESVKSYRQNQISLQMTNQL